MAATTHTSPFTLASVDVIRRLYPESLADKSFDNTGLLLESPLNQNRKTKLRNSVLLTIDLTQLVAWEAIERGVSLVVAYREWTLRFYFLRSKEFDLLQYTRLCKKLAQKIILRRS